VIVAYDPKFYEKLPTLFPHNLDAKNWFTSNDSLAATTAFRNGTLQGAYLIISARAMGLDTGAMSGFDNDTVDKAFFASNGWRSNFLCNIGYGDWAACSTAPAAGLRGSVHPRLRHLHACSGAGFRVGAVLGGGGGG